MKIFFFFQKYIFFLFYSEIHFFFFFIHKYNFFFIQKQRCPSLTCIFYPALVVAGATPPKTQATTKRVLYMPQQPCRYSATYFVLSLGGFRSQNVSIAFLGPWRRILSKTAYPNFIKLRKLFCV